jgi:5'-nucleotidase / UDP-sugar diphosphatase
VASNTLPPAGHPLRDLGILETHLLEAGGGLKIGFLGLLGKDAQQKAPLTDPVQFADPHEAAGKAVQALQAQGAQVIVALTHSGIPEDRALARAVPGIHLIVGGHCHTALKEPIQEGETLIVQSGELLQNLGILELAYDPASGKVRLRNGETGRPYLLPLDYTVPADAGIAARVEEYARDLNSLIREMTGGRLRDYGEILASSAFALPNTPPLKESPLGNFVADAMRLSAQAALGERVDFAFQFNGAIRGALTPGSMPYSQGIITFYDLVDLVGLGSGPDGQAGYPLVALYLTGEEVRRMLEVVVLLSELMGDSYFPQVSGLRMTYDPNRAVLFRVPVKNIPVPTSRAVLSADRYTGEGLQDSDAYAPLKRGDEALYHVVVDRYTASFLPMVGEMLPNLALLPKDKAGNPVDILERMVYREGQELKLWQAVVEYAAAQPPGPDGKPRISEYYRSEAGRLVQARTVPLLLWPALAVLILLALLILFLRKRRARRRAAALY